MLETMADVIDEISDQEVALLNDGYRAGFILIGKEQFIVLMHLYKKELMSPKDRAPIDGSTMFSGMSVVIDNQSDDRFEVVPESSLRTDSLLRMRSKKSHE